MSLDADASACDSYKVLSFNIKEIHNSSCRATANSYTTSYKLGIKVNLKCLKSEHLFTAIATELARVGVMDSIPTTGTSFDSTNFRECGKVSSNKYYCVLVNRMLFHQATVYHLISTFFVI